MMQGTAIEMELLAKAHQAELLDAMGANSKLGLGLLAKAARLLRR